MTTQRVHIIPTSDSVCLKSIKERQEYQVKANFLMICFNFLHLTFTSSLFCLLSLSLSFSALSKLFTPLMPSVSHPLLPSVLLFHYSLPNSFSFPFFPLYLSLPSSVSHRHDKTRQKNEDIRQSESNN